MVVQVQEAREVREVQEAQMVYWVVRMQELCGRVEKVQDRQDRCRGLALVVRRDRGWLTPGRWRSGCEDAWRRSDRPKEGGGIGESRVRDVDPGENRWDDQTDFVEGCEENLSLASY